MTIKFLSLNLWHGTLIDKVLEFLENENADILALQEVHSSPDTSLPRRLRCYELIQDKFKYPAQYFAAGLLFNHPEGKVLNGNAIFSKFPIKERDMRFFHETFNDDYHDIPENYPKYPRILQHVAVDTPAGEVNVFNFHGVWDLEGDNYSERRAKMSEIIIEAVKDKQNVILAGDTNAKPTNKAMRDIEKHLMSVFGDSLATTFNMKRKDNPGYATAAVDMIFTSPNIRVLSKRCPVVDISDHLPLSAELDIS